jgi:hypothetical protein
VVEFPPVVTGGGFIMKIFLNIICLVFTLVITTIGYADNLLVPAYTIIIDAGSTGSRLHIFQVQTDKSSMVPIIREIGMQANKQGLATFASHPEDAGASFQPLLDYAATILQARHINPQNVTIHVLGTAGMRMVESEVQRAIYASVAYYIGTHSTLTLGKVETIPGKMEGLYGWLDVNYLDRTFQDNRPTVGSIDMGGASTQIAFATQDNSKPDDETTLTVGLRTYTVFSKSFLGLGLDEARNTLDENTSANLCYPANYPLTDAVNGNFDFAACNKMYDNILQQDQVEQQLLPEPQDMTFIAYSGIYYAYQFFGVDKTPDENELDARILTVCKESWDQLQKDYPHVPAKYLAEDCANGVYIDDLLYTQYQLQGTNLVVENQIDQANIDWTLGAMLYDALTSTVSSHLK